MFGNLWAPVHFLCMALLWQAPRLLHCELIVRSSTFWHAHQEALLADVVVPKCSFILDTASVVYTLCSSIPLLAVCRCLCTEQQERQQYGVSVIVQ